MTMDNCQFISTCSVVKRGEKSGSDPVKSIEKKGEREVPANPSGSLSQLPVPRGGFGRVSVPEKQNEKRISVRLTGRQSLEQGGH